MIDGIVQPEFIDVDKELRLRKFDNNYEFALSWYEDKELVKLVDGKNAKPYDMEKLKRMYTYLNNNGELYFIEIKIKDRYIPIGDVSFWHEDMPIVIGDKSYQGKGIGYRVIKTLIERGKEFGYEKLYVNEIYAYNTQSQRVFEKAGFKIYKETNNGYSYVLDI